MPDRADVPHLLNLVHSLPVDFLLTGILVFPFFTDILVFISHKYPRYSIFHNMIILIDLMIIVFIILIFTDPFQSMMKLCSSEVHLQLNHLDINPRDNHLENPRDDHLVLLSYHCIDHLQAMRKPFLKFICTSASYFFFLFLLILVSQRIEDIMG